MSDGMLSLDETMQYLDLNRTGVEELIKKNKLTAYKIGGTYLRFRKDQVEMLLSKDKKEHIVLERVKNFWEFNNFYILAGMCILCLLYFALR
ncbi:MAG: helix-turn-helix domain-containing protein [Candidatus Omnitrophica bacterium]|nr:helix-turn-helix domain-containing protein [Candidatus Omnitrophota bacterium]